MSWLFGISREVFKSVFTRHPVRSSDAIKHDGGDRHRYVARNHIVKGEYLAKLQDFDRKSYRKTTL